MVEQISLNIPSTVNTVRIKRKLSKANLKVERNRKDGGKEEHHTGKNQDEDTLPEEEKQNGIDIIV
jgi:hypothetical protein